MNWMYDSWVITIKVPKNMPLKRLLRNFRLLYFSFWIVVGD